MCRSLTKVRQCPFFTGVQKRKKDSAEVGTSEVHDIEDLLSLGRQQMFCPFFAERDSQLTADIIFLPYNYLVDPDIRRTLQLSLKNNIVIVDEAHNIAGMMTAAASFDLPSIQLANSIAEVQHAMEILHQPTGPDDVQLPQEERALELAEYLGLKRLLLKLEEAVSNVALETRDGKPILVRNGDWLLEFLAEVGITRASSQALLDSLQKVINTLADEADSTGFRREPAIQGLQEHIRMLFHEGEEGMKASFKALLQRDVDANPPTSKRAPLQVTTAGRTLSLWCMDPSISVARLVRNAAPYLFILTSGTLSPIPSFAAELQLDFPIQLENPHVIETKQVSALVIPKGPRGTSLNSSFNLRDRPEYKTELGMLLVNLCRIVPHGILVFFPSYSVLTSSLEAWKAPTGPGSKAVWESICAHKTPVVEPRESSQLKAVFDEYNACIASDQGAIFFAVCRGKVSEGLDFADNAGRAVVVTGLPYPNRADLRVQLMKTFLDERCRATKGKFNGTQWYMQQASRAVNQCVGRIIRHRHDFGAVLFCDERFGEAQNVRSLSSWLRPQVQVTSAFGDVVRTLSNFYRVNGESPVLAPPRLTSSAVHNRAFVPPRSTAPAADGGPLPPRLDGPSAEDIGKQARQFWRDAHHAPDLVAQLGSTPQRVPPPTSDAPLLPGGDHRPPPAPAPRPTAPTNGPTPVSNPENGPHARTHPRNTLAAHPTPSTHGTVGVSNNDPKADAKQYLSLVRQQLTPAEYLEFKSVLQAFKDASATVGSSTQAEVFFDSLVQQCIALFGSRTGLLQGFSQFTPAPFRGRYQQAIEAVTGASADVSASTAHKRSEAALDPGHVDLVTGKTKKQRTAAPMLAEPLPTSLLLPTIRPPPHISNVGDASVTPVQSPAVEGASTVPSGFTCQVCQEPCQEPYSSRCGHVCCLTCWERWLEQRLECPICRAKVRLKLLTRLHV
eukprot:GGOE01015347.1.p1 GENE.GGOE01015347.1~~GGOE01015347.1.p1  ORF type:complete len:1110 (-),score=252.04 GGOE01015347.1:226-3090(-)